MFRDYPSEDAATVDRTQVWMEPGQPLLQLSLDVVMYENYDSSITAHAGTGWWNNSGFTGPALGGDGNLRFGLFQEPIVNCNAMSNSFEEAKGYYPDMAKDNTFPPSALRSALWMGAVTANAVSQLLWLFGTDPVPYGPWQQANMAAQWATEVEELMPSLYAPFGTRDAVTASVAQTPQEIAGLATAAELRLRSWQEQPDCVHVVLININTSVPARPTVVLTGATAGLQGGEAKRLFDAVYNVPTKALSHDVLIFTDWVAAGHANAYRLGSNCSDTAVWRHAIHHER